tara:strand:- start:836 stop:2629 length:1794 start_codon:yes stop_codon:yes gene_type:complete
MKLSRLYTNDDALFASVNFREGLNAIIARIQHPTDDDKSSHCLGKTLIIDVIDFCLLKSVGKKGHFLKVRDDLFGHLTFFLEIELQTGGFLTVRRAVDDATKVAFKRHRERHQDLSQMIDENWDHVGVSLSASVKMLDAYLALKAIKPWSYRKGFNYFLRRQEDYANEFQLRKFMNGNHKDWKPYVAKVLGFDETKIIEKYEADTEESTIKAQRDDAQGNVAVKISDYEKLKARILAKSDDVSGKLESLDRFDFDAQEMGVNQKLADEIEDRIADLNIDIYNARFDLSQVRKGLDTKIEFNLEDVKSIFSEAEIAFPQQLEKDYSDLVEFNKKIHGERHDFLKKRASELEKSLSSLESEMSKLSSQRMEALKILKETNSLEKFKLLQKELDGDRASLAIMEEKAARIEEIKALDDRLRRVKKRKQELGFQIEDLIERGNERYKGIQKVFSRIIKDVLHRTAVLYVNQNKEGNVEFHAEYTDSESDQETQERKGTSFRKILCIAFDLSVLINYSKDQFFHFVYHDGALEQLESKRKLALLDVVRKACVEYGVQYIFSAIDEELPPYDDPSRLSPSSEEIVLELHDGGKEGRLFKTDTF